MTTEIILGGSRLGPWLQRKGVSGVEEDLLRVIPAVVDPEITTRYLVGLASILK